MTQNGNHVVGTISTFQGSQLLLSWPEPKKLQISSFQLSPQLVRDSTAPAEQQLVKNMREREPVVSASQQSPAVAQLIKDVHGFHVPLLSMQQKIKNEQLLRVPEARHKILNLGPIRYGIKLF